MLVYRIQDKDGYGPFSNGFYATTSKFKKHNDDQIHPTPFEEGLLDKDNIDKDYHCGFSSKNRLNKWFTGIQKELTAGGFVIAVYQVDQQHVKRGETQLVFRKSKSKFIKAERIARKR